MANLLLVDFENVHRVDTSRLDSSFEVVIFVGATQTAPAIPKDRGQHKPRLKVTFQKISGNGRNALDFHVAFHLGRVYETARETRCYVLSRDKGFDPLLTFLNANGLTCTRVGALSEINPAFGPCPRCTTMNLIEHNDGLWCAICGRFMVNPDPKYTAHLPPVALHARHDSGFIQRCDHCGERTEMGDGLYDDGEWMCGGCIAGYARW